MRHTAAIITILILSLDSSAQVDKKKNYFPIWTFHQDDINIHGISIGLASLSGTQRNTNTNGIKYELIGIGIGIPLIGQSPTAANDSEFVKLKQAPLSERINGLNLSTSGSVCHCLTNGITAGIIGQTNFQVNGISSSIFMIFNQQHNGVMVAVFNEAYYLNGVQIGFSNYGSRAKGLQLGAMNEGHEEMKGVQIGLLNRSKKLKGIQMGLWNVNQKRKLPFINWSFADSKKNE